MLDWLSELVSSGEDLWGQSKAFAERLVGIDNDALHVLAGPLLLFLTASLMRKSVQSVWPWTVVLLLGLVNEWHDLRAERWPDRTMQYGEGVKDLLLTMALPTLILILARVRVQLFVGPRAETADRPDDKNDHIGS